jgi:hypothetical protein
MPQSWLLLLHQIPPKPPYLRAKILRRLNQLGALAIKNSAYVIPETNETMEDLQWVRFAVADGAGETWLFRAEPLAGLTTDSLVASFRRMRSVDYKQLLDDARQLLTTILGGGYQETERRKLQRRFDDLRRIDFFDAPGREEMDAIMENINKALGVPERRPAPKPDLDDLKGRTWVTRRGVKVDRIATAWMIRRFIDPAAQFRFVDPDQYQHSAREIRFEMFEGEFTHEGDLCTFETLLRHIKPEDPALDALAEVIHDIDMKDEKYQRPETNGLAAMILGVAALYSEDERRIEDGGRIFEAAYAGLRASPKN